MSKGQKDKVVACYCRVSTEGQRHDSQVVDLQAYIENHGLRPVRWYKEKISGAADKLPVLDRLEADVFKGEVGMILVWKLDRVSRKGILDGLNRLGGWLNKGIRFVSLQEQFDFSNSLGELMAAFCFHWAKVERENLIRRIRAGQRAARAKGTHMGRRPGIHTPWNPAKRKVDVDLAKSLRRKGVAVAEIAKKFTCSRVAVYQALA